MPLARTRLPYRRWLPWLACLILLACCATAQAQECHASGAFGMNFGTVNANGGSSTSHMHIVCAPDYSGANRTLYYHTCIYMGPGQWSAGQATRRMSNYNGSYLDYDLFADPAHTQLIGPVGSTPVYQQEEVVPPGQSVTTTVLVYGKVYPNQSVAASNNYQEQAIEGTVVFRYSTASGSAAEDCNSGGLGGGSIGFQSSGVTAAFENTCRVAATNLNFGQVIALTQAVTETSTITVQCPANASWRIGMDNGQSYSAGQRRMSGNGNFVAYQLYRDASRTQVWGNTDDAMVLGSTDSGANAVHVTVYGQVPAQPEVPAGDYADTIVVTLYY